MDQGNQLIVKDTTLKDFFNKGLLKDLLVYFWSQVGLTMLDLSKTIEDMEKVFLSMKIIVMKVAGSEIFHKDWVSRYLLMEIRFKVNLLKE